MSDLIAWGSFEKFGINKVWEQGEVVRAKSVQLGELGTNSKSNSYNFAIRTVDLWDCLLSLSKSTFLCANLSCCSFSFSFKQSDNGA